MILDGRSDDAIAAAVRALKAGELVGLPTETVYGLAGDAGNDRVLGLHMIGPDAPEIVQSLAAALTAGATKAHFDRTIAMHPTAAEEFVLMREPARTVAPAAAS